MSVSKTAFRRRTLLRAFALLAGLLGMPANLHAATTAEIQALIKADQLDQAMNVTEAALRDDADNIELRFLKGLIHTRRNELDAAADAFEALTRDHPDLPEPYNNLAVVYAAQGEYDKARQTLLRAINTHPSYATAYENIGDIYTKMASEAYIQALQLDEGNISAREKLSLVNELFSTNLARQSALARADPRVEPQVEPRVAAEQEQVREAAPVPPPEPEPPVMTEPASEPEPPSAEPAPESTAAVPEEEPPVTTPPPTGPEPAPATEVAVAAPAEPTPEPLDETRAARELIEQTVRNWARVWAAQDVEGYLGYYADDFRPGDGLSRADWATQRRERLTAPSYINLKIEDVRVQIDETTGEARARFRQTYESNTFSSSIMKTLHLTQSDDGWRIKQELTE